jgi:hypothetical protein
MRKVSDNGYGHTSAGGKFYLAHRKFFTENGGVIEDGHVVDHTCKNRMCVNPDHLRSVTYRFNVIDHSVGPVAENARRVNCGKCGNALEMYGSRGRTCPSCFKERDALNARINRMLRRINNPLRFAHA